MTKGKRLIKQHWVWLSFILFIFALSACQANANDPMNAQQVGEVINRMSESQEQIVFSANPAYSYALPASAEIAEVLSVDTWQAIDKPETTRFDAMLYFDLYHDGASEAFTRVVLLSDGHILTQFGDSNGFGAEQWYCPDLPEGETVFDRMIDFTDSQSQ